jgi:hypothetical protein
MSDDVEQQWTAWAQRERLGGPAQVEAAAKAAVAAVMRGATTDTAAALARQAAASSSVAPAPRDAARPPTRTEVAAPGGITWEMAMENAAYCLNQLPRAAEIKISRTNALAEFNLALAQGWITFAREVTMHGRSLR